MEILSLIFIIMLIITAITLLITFGTMAFLTVKDLIEEMKETKAKGKIN